MSIESARNRVAVAGQFWKLRLVADATGSTPRTRRELRTAISQLDGAIADLFDAVYLADHGKRRRAK